MIMNKCSISSLERSNKTYQDKNDAFVKVKIDTIYEPKAKVREENIVEDFKPIDIKKFSALRVYNKRWYYLLNHNPERKTRALLQDHPKSSLKNHLIVSWEPVSLPDREVGNTKLLYSYFDSYIDFFIYSKKFIEREKTFYETIIGDFYQKPHFDVDVKDVPDIDNLSNYIIEKLIWSIIETFKNKFNIDIEIEKDILLYKSHGETKRSNHIVINNYCHANNKEARYFYDECLKLIRKNDDKDITKYIDHAVYGKSQQYRIVGCQKRASARPKVFCEKFIYNGVEYTHQFLENKEICVLYESLVSFTSGCKLLPCIQPEETKMFLKKDGIGFDEENVGFIMNCVTDYFGFGVFSYDNIQGDFLNLRRLKPSFCQYCKRIHNSQNPYITIWENNVYFNCRRSADGKGFKITELKKEDPKSLDNSDDLEQEDFDKGIFNFIPKGYFDSKETPESVKISESTKDQTGKDKSVKDQTGKDKNLNPKFTKSKNATFSRKFDPVKYNSRMAEKMMERLIKSGKI